jgi:hypothetical protein
MNIYVYTYLCINIHIYSHTFTHRDVKIYKKYENKLFLNIYLIDYLADPAWTVPVFYIFHPFGLIGQG